MQGASRCGWQDVDVETLRTERLLLRPWTLDDTDFVFGLYSLWSVQQHIGLHPRVMTDRAEAIAVITRWQGMDHPVHAIRAVTDADTGEIFGNVLLKSIPASSSATPLQPSGDTEIGWHFHPNAWHHGYATEAASAVLAEGWKTGLDRVVAVTTPSNRPSQRVCLRIGMTHKGRTDQYYNSVSELFVAVAPET